MTYYILQPDCMHVLMGVAKWQMCTRQMAKWCVCFTSEYISVAHVTSFTLTETWISVKAWWRGRFTLMQLMLFFFIACHLLIVTGCWFMQVDRSAVSGPSMLETGLKTQKGSWFKWRCNIKISYEQGFSYVTSLTRVYGFSDGSARKLKCLRFKITECVLVFICKDLNK